MDIAKSRAVALMAASLILFNAFHLAPLLSSDEQKGWLVLVSTCAGIVCLIAGVILFRREMKK